MYTNFLLLAFSYWEVPNQLPNPKECVNLEVIKKKKLKKKKKGFAEAHTLACVFSYPPFHSSCGSNNNKTTPQTNNTQLLEYTRIEKDTTTTTNKNKRCVLTKRHPLGFWLRQGNVLCFFSVFLFFTLFNNIITS